jgi:hypothetical protein
MEGTKIFQNRKEEERINNYLDAQVRILCFNIDVITERNILMHIITGIILDIVASQPFRSKYQQTICSSYEQVADTTISLNPGTRRVRKPPFENKYF